jgi:hypothetical protein
MRAKRAVDIIAIELRDANQNEARISSYLRSRQAQGKELKSEVMTAMTAWLSRPSGDKHCLFKGLERSGNHLNKQANNFSFIRSKFLNP